MLRLLTVMLILAAALVAGASFGRGATLSGELTPRVWLIQLGIVSIPFALLTLAAFSTRQYVVADLTALLFACLVLAIDVYDLCVSDSFRTGGRISTPLMDFSITALLEALLGGLSLLFVWCLRWIITPAVVDEPRPGRVVVRRRRPPA
jgi:hypothetical protein